jgi:NAD(P)-dependent dehydrogenase (short-subunit alcohol dehydrogenase family)
VTLAREGATIVGFDLCEASGSPPRPGPPRRISRRPRLVEEQDQRCLVQKLDARDLPGLTALAEATMAEFGRVDPLVVNQGIWSNAPNSWELEEASW